jgi:hypothetical protein
MLIWLTLLLLGEGAGGSPPVTPTVSMFSRRRRRNWTPKA